MAIAYQNQAVKNLLNQIVTRVALEQWAIIIVFEDGELRIEGGWSLNDSENILDQSIDFPQRTAFSLWRILGLGVSSLEITSTPMPILVLHLGEDLILEVPANDDGLEDWSLAASTQTVVCNGEAITVFSR